MVRSHFLALAAPAGVTTWAAGNSVLTAIAHIAAIERRSGGRLGMYAVDTSNRRYFGHRDAERFPMCSTFKLLAVAAVLARVDSGTEQLNRPVAFSHADLLAYAPVTQQYASAGSMTIFALCAAAIEWSDNTAANLLLRSIGGPAGVTRYAGSLGDRQTRLDRTEPELNTALAGDARDTTTPHAMASDALSLLTGRALSSASRSLLTTWLTASRTGRARLRAGVPQSWRAGDKTGSGDNGTTNDVAIFWPPKRRPIVAAVYLTGAVAAAEHRDALLADVGRTIAAAFK